MTEKDGKFYCDLCKSVEPIPKGKGFWFKKPNFGIDHAHQTCYNNYYSIGKEFLHGQ